MNTEEIHRNTGDPPSWGGKQPTQASRGDEAVRAGVGEVHSSAQRFRVSDLDAYLSRFTVRAKQVSASSLVRPITANQQFSACPEKEITHRSFPHDDNQRDCKIGHRIGRTVRSVTRLSLFTNVWNISDQSPKKRPDGYDKCDSKPNP